MREDNDRRDRGPALSRQQVETFERDGYLIVEDVVSPSVRASVIREYGEILDRIESSLEAKGELRTRAVGQTFLDRLPHVVRESGRQFPFEFDISLGPVSEHTGRAIHTGAAAFALLTDPDLLDLVESIVGPEILSNPIQHARIKPPRNCVRTEETAAVVATPWHQDQAVHLPDADGSGMLTVWIAITRATRENGCLRVVPGSHRRGLLPHTPGPAGLIVDAADVATAEGVAAEVGAGGVVLVHPRMLHGSFENTTANEVRFSFDVRYQPVGRPTGRPWYPAFVARSRRDPSSVLRDAAGWSALWDDAAQALEHNRDGLVRDRWSREH